MEMPKGVGDVLRPLEKLEVPKGVGDVLRTLENLERNLKRNNYHYICSGIVERVFEAYVFQRAKRISNISNISNVRSTSPTALAISNARSASPTFLPMPTVKRFEELQVWLLAEAQCNAFYDLVKEGRFKNHFSLQDQMDRSSGSVMDNIAEGFDRFSKADFRHFLVIARGSNAEFRSQLYRCKSREIIAPETFEMLKQAAAHLGAKLHHFINYLTKTTFKHKPLAPVLPAEKHLEEAAPDYGGADLYTFPEEFLR